MQVLYSSPPAIIARCVHSQRGRRGPPPAPPPAIMGQHAPKLICHCDLANASAREAARLCRLLLYTNIFPGTEAEYGIASNAVTVLTPDLVESVCAIDIKLIITFPPNTRLVADPPSSGAPHKVHLSAEIRNHHRPIFLASIIEQLVPVVDDGCGLPFIRLYWSVSRSRRAGFSRWYG